MRRYETFVIVDPDISPEQREPVVDRVKELIAQQGGFLAFEDVWGERKLAYEIKKKERGYYIRFDYCGQTELVNEIERFFRIDDRALKFMTVVLDKDVDLEKVKEEQAAAEKQSETKPVMETTEAAIPAGTAETAPQAVEVPSDQETQPAAPVEAAAAPAEAEAAPAAETAESAETTNPDEKKEETS
jgi:small subunit ribosomal protein S6